ncbi:MAG: hypothetical protein ACK4SA_21725, partial [Caldilinea sp.]
MSTARTCGGLFHIGGRVCFVGHRLRRDGRHVAPEAMTYDTRPQLEIHPTCGLQPHLSLSDKKVWLEAAPTYLTQEKSEGTTTRDLHGRAGAVRAYLGRGYHTG